MLGNWAREGQMEFNEEKCVMHIGTNNGSVKYLMNGVQLYLSVTNTEKDLGVMISDDLKPSQASVGQLCPSFVFLLYNVLREHLALGTLAYTHFPFPTER